MLVRFEGPHGSAVLWAIPAAVSGTLGLWAFYRGMAVGAVSVVAPIAGVSAIVPVAIGIATGDRPSLWQYVGMALVLPGVGLAAREHHEGKVQLAAGVPLAVVAAIGFGGYFVPMHAAGKVDFWWASLVFRATTLAVVAVCVLAVRAPVALTRADVVYVALVGIGDTLGNVFYAASSGHGLVSVTAVLASLYPIATIVLARFVLHEQVDRSQQVGIAATLAGVVLVSAG